MSSPYDDDVLLQQYNAHRDLEWEPAQVEIPEDIQPPMTLDDYKALSSLTVSAYEHAHCIGSWCRDRGEGRPIGKYAVEDLARHVYGLRLLNRRLNKSQARGDFSMFDGVSPSPVSVHTEMMQAICNRHSGLTLLYLRLLQVDLVTFAKYEPDKVTRMFNAAGVQSFPFAERWSTYAVASAELSKIAVYFGYMKTATISPKSVMTGHDNQEKKPLPFPENPDVLEMCRYLQKHVQDRGTQIGCAREWCQQNNIEDGRCDLLFRQCQRFPWLWKPNWEGPKS